MPKIQIKEIDNTGAIQLNSISNVVYIPGLSASGNVAPTLYSSTGKLEDAVKDGILVAEDSYKFAHKLLEMGMQVLYEGCEGGDGVESEEKQYTTSILEGVDEMTADKYNYFKVTGIGNYAEFVISDNEVTFTYLEESGEGSGSEVIPHELSVAIVDGKVDFSSVIETYPAIANIITYAEINPSYKTVKYKKYVVVKATSIVTPNWSRLNDKNEYNVRFLTTGAYALDAAGMITCASTRQDCVALVDHPKTLKNVGEVRDYIEAQVLSDGLYCSAFTPWVKIKLSDSSIVDLPGSAGYLIAYARSVQTNPSWYAVAGSFRGTISGLVEPLIKYSRSECEELQARASTGEVDLDQIGDNVGISINPICNVRPFGYIVFGNRTAVNNDGNTKATSFLNVRNLISTLKKELFITANKYTFEQNSEVLWTNFKAQISTLLDQMQSGNGIEGYKLVRQATDKKARLKAKVVIVPIEAVEDFELTVSLEDSLEVVE